MISKDCLYLIVTVKDLDFEIPPIESFFVVNEFQEVCPNDLPVIPPEQDIDFGIDSLSVTPKVVMSGVFWEFL